MINKITNLIYLEEIYIEYKRLRIYSDNRAGKAISTTTPTTTKLNTQTQTTTTTQTNTTTSKSTTNPTTQNQTQPVTDKDGWINKWY